MMNIRILHHEKMQNKAISTTGQGGRTKIAFQRLLGQCDRNQKSDNGIYTRFWINPEQYDSTLTVEKLQKVHAIYKHAKYQNV